MLKKQLLLFLVLGAVGVLGCADDTKKGAENTEQKKAQEPNAIVFQDLKSGAQFALGGLIPLEIKVNQSKKITDSIAVYWDDQLIFRSAKKKALSHSLNTDNYTLGKHLIKVVSKGKDGKVYGDSREVILFSGVQPTRLVAQINQKLPHNSSHYTQGLEFYNGLLWEGTGQYGSSLIAATDIRSGEVVREKKLSDKYFGEGITIFQDKIYQLTYKAGKCFVYDLFSLSKKNTFQYSGEGWGLTHNDSSIIMSDGSYNLYFKDPNTFQTQRKIQVFSNTREFGNLNELEWVNGYIYANIYTTQNIIKIDPKTGKVLEVIDCSNIARQAMTPSSDVLNGVAFDAGSGKLYITGKFWQYVYEVSFNLPA